MVCPDQSDDVVENRVELATLQDFLSVALGDVEDGVAGGNLDLGVLVDEAVRDRSNHIIQKLGHCLPQLVLVALANNTSEHYHM